MSGHDGLQPDPGRRRFIDLMGLYYENYGIPRIGGRIIGLLMTEGGPVSAEQIAGALSVSRSSVSTNVRLLLVTGFVEVAPGQEGRADRFTLSPDAWGHAIRARIEGFKNLKVIAAEGIAALRGDEAATGQVREMADWADAMIEGHERILEGWRSRRGGAGCD